jgi:hypothetical protein
MNRIKDVDGQSLLYNPMILYGSGNADGNHHTTHQFAHLGGRLRLRRIDDRSLPQNRTLSFYQPVPEHGGQNGH